MTWKDLLNEMKYFTPEQLNQDVTVYVEGVNEFYPLLRSDPLRETDEYCDVLDPNHKYLVI